MPATSKAQQRLFGLAYAIKKGDIERSEADDKAVEIADSMSLKDLKKFAETDHEGLPDKVKESLVNEGKGLSEASKLIKNLRDKVYPKFNDDELSEFKKEMVEHLGGTIEENLSPGNIGGMGPVGFPSNFNGAADGSGDVPAGRGDAEEEYKKKKKEREEELKKNKNESMIFTDFNQFLNEEYQANGKYNTVKKVIKELGRRPSEQELATFITKNYYDVTEVERGDDDPSANDKIADLVAFYKFDIDDWNIAWLDAQNESLVTESVNEAFYPSTRIGAITNQKDLDKFDNDPFIRRMYKQDRIMIEELDISYDDEWQIFIDKKDKEVIKFLKKNYPQHLQIDTYLANQLAESVNEAKIEDLHFEMDPDRLEGMKIEFGANFGGVTDHEKIEDAEYQLRKFRKKIKYWNGNKRDQEWAEGVFAGPEHYNTIKSTLGAGPHAKKKKKIRWTEKKYEEWIESVASNGGAEHAFDMAQNAKQEPGLVDWVKKNLTYDETPLERIQWDIEALAESVHEAKESNARENLGYVAFLKKMSDLNAKDRQRAYQSAVNVLVDKGMTEKQAVGFLNSPHGKYMAEYVTPANDFSHDAFLDKLDEYYNERMLKKLAKDFEKLG